MEETDNGGMDIEGEETQGRERNGWTGKGVSDTGRGTRHVMGTAELLSEVSTHGFCNWGTTAMFDIQ